MEPSKLSRTGQNLFKVIEFDEDERLISEIRKHPFGLFLIYVSGIIISVILFAIFLGIAWFANAEFSEEVGQYGDLFTLAGLVMSLLGLGVTGIAGYIYSNNIMLVTNEKIAQVLYKSLFSRKISQLSIGDVQDVTVTQDGVLARIFNYGTIVIETAGEQQNYRFTFAPHPYYFAKQMVGSHEQNLEKYGN